MKRVRRDSRAPSSSVSYRSISVCTLQYVDTSFVESLDHLPNLRRDKFRRRFSSENYENTIDRNEAWITTEPKFHPSFILRRSHCPYHAASTDAECTNVHRGFVCPTSCDLRRRTQTSPRSPTHPPAQGIIKHTQACDVRCWIAYWLYPRRYNATKVLDNKKIYYRPRIYICIYTYPASFPPPKHLMILAW